MKKFLNYFLLASLTTLSIVSCKHDEEPFYDGDSELLFTQEKGDAYVTVGTNHTDYIVKYGVSKAVSGTHQVKLVADAANSTAVEGVDYQILNNATDDITDGEVFGQFTVRILESGMSQTPKIAKFKLQSSTIASAAFHDIATVNMSLTCPVSYFIGTGSFKYGPGYWQATPNNYVIVNDTSGTTPKFKIKGFMDDGSDLVVNYDPVTFAVTVPLQPTGAVEPGYGYAYAQDATNGAKSSYNPCTRVLTLNIYYHTRQSATGPITGQYGNGTEVFTGQ